MNDLIMFPYRRVSIKESCVVISVVEPIIAMQDALRINKMIEHFVEKWINCNYQSIIQLIQEIDNHSIIGHLKEQSHEKWQVSLSFWNIP